MKPVTLNFSPLSNTISWLRLSGEMSCWVTLNFSPLSNTSRDCQKRHLVDQPFVFSSWALQKTMSALMPLHSVSSSVSPTLVNTLWIKHTPYILFAHGYDTVWFITMALPRWTLWQTCKLSWLPGALNSQTDKVVTRPLRSNFDENKIFIPTTDPIHPHSE